MKLNVPILGQRDSRWSNILLGYNKNQPYTIGNYGCLITCFSMLVDKTPDTVNTTLKNNNGYVAGTGNFVWSKSTVLGLNQLYLSPKYTGPVTDQGVSKAKEILDQGYPLVAEVDFNPATTGSEQHFVLITGYEGDTFYINDPWTADQTTLDKYGGFKRGVIQYRQYDKKFKQGTVKPTVEVYTDVFESLVDKSSTLDESAKKLGVTTNRDIFLGEIDKLVKFEDVIQEKDRKITELQDELSDLQQTLEDQSDILDELSSTNVNLLETIGEQKSKISSLTKDVETALVEIKSLKDKLLDPSTTWIEDIQRGIKKLLSR